MNNAELYTQHNRFSSKYEMIVDIYDDCKQLLNFRKNEAVLDAGCGPGDVTSQVLVPLLPYHFRNVLAVDISRTMIAWAQRHYAWDKLGFATLDLEAYVPKLWQNTNSFAGFDKVFSFFALHWVQNLEKCVQNIHNLLNKRGEALLAFPVDRRFQKTFERMRSSEKWREHFVEKIVRTQIPPFPLSDAKEEFVSIAQKAGFKVMKCDVKVLYSDYPDIEAFKELVESLDPHIKCIPSELKDQYLDDCVKDIEHYGALDIGLGAVIFQQTLLTCVLHKT